MAEVVMVMGFPASGKTRTTESYVQNGYVRLNRDTEGGSVADLLPKLDVLLKGKKNVVLMFYPLDWSPVCTNEHACFVNDMKQFEQLSAHCWA